MKRIQPVRMDRPGATDVATPIQVASAVQLTQRAVKDVQRQNPLPTFFPDLACGSGGATLRLRHGFGRRARWEVVDWKRTTPGGTHGLERVSDDGNLLILASYVAGVATLKVY